MHRGRVIIPVLLMAAVLIGIQVSLSASGLDTYLNALIVAAYHAVVVMGLCLLMGYAGQVSLGHGAFFALGGYTSAVLTTRNIAHAQTSAWGRLLQEAGVLAVRENLYGEQIMTTTPWAAFVAAIVLVAAVAILVGYPSLRLKGHYLAMATLGFGLIVYRLLLGTEWTGSADGISSVPPWDLGFGLTVSGRAAHRVQNYYIAWALALLVLLVLLNIVRSRVGRALRAIHEGETAANAMGINTAALKLKTFVISAVLAATAGCFLTHYNRGIYPSASDALHSVRYVALVAAGGMANLWGVLVISTALNFLSLRGSFGSYDHAFFGAILIVIVSLVPNGPLRPIGAWLARLGRAIPGRRKEAADGPA